MLTICPGLLHVAEAGVILQRRSADVKLADVRPISSPVFIEIIRDIVESFGKASQYPRCAGRFSVGAYVWYRLWFFSHQQDGTTASYDVRIRRDISPRPNKCTQPPQGAFAAARRQAIGLRAFLARRSFRSIVDPGMGAPGTGATCRSNWLLSSDRCARAARPEHARQRPPARGRHDRQIAPRRCHRQERRPRLSPWGGKSPWPECTTTTTPAGTYWTTTHWHQTLARRHGDRPAPARRRPTIGRNCRCRMAVMVDLGRRIQGGRHARPRVTAVVVERDVVADFGGIADTKPCQWSMKRRRTTVAPGISMTVSQVRVGKPRERKASGGA